MSKKTICSHRFFPPELKEFILQQAIKLNGRALDNNSILELCILVKRDGRFKRGVHPNAVRRLLQGQNGGGNPRPSVVGKPLHRGKRNIPCCVH
jgi:hypothetical protein